MEAVLVGSQAKQTFSSFDDDRNPQPCPDARLGRDLRNEHLVVHHSLASGGGLRSASCDRLLELAEAYHIAAILTGHTHDFLAKPMDTLPNKLRKVYELRSASALQGPENRLKPSPGILAHRIFVDANQVRWQAWRYEWDSSNKSFAILSQDLANPFADFIVP
jgi:hypothetical protein